MLDDVLLAAQLEWCKFVLWFFHKMLVFAMFEDKLLTVNDTLSWEIINTLALNRPTNTVATTNTAFF